VKLSEHVDGFRRALGVRRALDRTLPRHPPPGPINLWRFRQNALALMRAAAPAGDVVRVDLLYRPTLLLQHPDDVAAVFEQPELWLRGEGLVPLLGHNTLTTNGDAWLFNRAAIQPSFHGRMVTRSADRFARVAADAIEAWAPLARAPEPVDLAALAVRLFARHATAAFGFDVTDDEAERLPEVLLRLQRWAFRVVAGGAPRTPQAKADFAVLDGIVARALAATPAAGEPPTLAERLRQDHDVPRETLRDHLLLALIAPSDNPPNGFAFAVWLLARNPEHQDAVRAEVARVLGDEPPTAEALDALPLLERTLQEAMRLLPPVWFLARTAQADTTLRGFRVPAGTMAFPSAWFVHRHPSAWERPEVFAPDRFLPAAVAARSRHAYLPFGSGPRMCIGARFATLEMRALLAAFLRRFRALSAGPEPLPLEGTFALRSTVGVPVRLAPVTP
jgi:cytochrome P450